MDRRHIDKRRNIFSARKELLKSDAAYEIVLIDATETPIERPQKNIEDTIPGKRKDTH